MVQRIKTLTKYLNEKLIINQRFDEKLIINKSYKDAQYTCTPKTFNELRRLIEDRYNKLGSGTKTNPIDFNDVDVSNIDSFFNIGSIYYIGIFEDTKFKYIDISDWDVSKVKNVSQMFCYCEQLKYIGDISNWDVSNVESMNSMFYKCSKLKSIGDISNWNISNVKNMNQMFCHCKQLTSVGDLSKWKVSDLRYIFNMFKNSGITNIPKWYKKMKSLIKYLTEQNLNILDIMYLTVSNVKNVNCMFGGCIEKIIPYWYYKL